MDDSNGHSSFSSLRISLNQDEEERFNNENISRQSGKINMELDLSSLTIEQYRLFYPKSVICRYPPQIVTVLVCQKIVTVFACQKIVTVFCLSESCNG